MSLHHTIQWVKRVFSRKEITHIVDEPETEPMVINYGDSDCSHIMEPHDWYEIPNPDPRNPIRVKKCSKCEREVDYSSKFFNDPIPPEYYE